jgi:LPS O-antigen subunit length determinant protein (WzzB/FepE family)
MDQNSDQSESIKDELVFFGGIINQLLQSKKIIIVTTLVFTISLFFYTLQQENIYKSSALIEIGSYRQADENNEILIEPVYKLITNNNLNIQKKKINTPMKFRRVNDSLLIIENQSPSIEKNNIAINQTINEIVNRHKDILVKIIHNKIDKLTILNNELTFLDKKISLSEQYDIEKETILSMDHTIDFYASLLFITLYNYENNLIDYKYERQKLIKEKNKLESQLDNNLSYIDTKLVNEIESTTINPGQNYTVFGLILGFMISISFVLINNFIKTYRRI